MASKLLERRHVEFLIRDLNLDWQLGDTEEPDFEVRTPTEVFGIEHTRVFRGSSSGWGSSAKRLESENQKIISEVHGIYYAKGGRPTCAKFLGEFRGADIRTVADTLLEGQPSRPGEQCTLQPIEGLKVSLLGAFPGSAGSDYWIQVDDRVGWVRRADAVDLQRGVDRKAKKIAEYREKYRVVDLVLVADRIFNSARLDLPDGVILRNPGFRSIYFVSYPYAAMRMSPGLSERQSGG